MVFNEPKPEHGREFVPPEGTVPNNVLMSKIAFGILKKLQEVGSRYEGATN
jgi:hypothetical protein